MVERHFFAERHYFDDEIKKSIVSACCLLILLLLCVGRANAAAEGDIDLVFVIDNSGSMRKNDPDFLTRETVRAFMHRLSPETRVAMVMFDEKAELLEPLTLVSDEQAHSHLSRRLDSIDYRGQFTNSAAGIERALYELKTSGRPLAQRSIIFLTDGILDTGNKQKDAALTKWLKNDLAEQSRKEGVSIYGIAFTDNADFSLIQILSQRSGGAYYRAFQPEAIADMLSKIHAQLVEAKPKSLESDPVQPQISQPPAAPTGPTPDEMVAARESAPTVASLSLPDVDQEISDRNLFSKRILNMTIGFLILCICSVLVLVPRMGERSFWKNKRRKSYPSPVAGLNYTPEVTDLPEWQLFDLEETDHPVTHFNKTKITIGRDEENNLVVAHPTVSNFHATIEYKNQVFFLEDKRSSNGTHLNDREIPFGQPVWLKSGDRIKFANHEFQFVRLDQLISGDTVMIPFTDLAAKQECATHGHLEVPMEMPIKDEKSFARALEHHLAEITALGPKYAQFVKTCFTADMMDTLSCHGHRNMHRESMDGDHQDSSFAIGPVFYVVCSLTMPISNAANWFGEHHGGFTSFIRMWLDSKAYAESDCDTLCIVVFGLDQEHWASVTIVPTHDAEDAVELLSLDFLNDVEQRSMEFQLDEVGCVH